MPPKLGRVRPDGSAQAPSPLLLAWTLGARADHATAAAIRRLVTLVVLAELLAAGRTTEAGPRRVGRGRPGAADARARGVRLARGSLAGRRPRG